MLKALPAARWDYDTAAHLLNRAGFGGPPAVIENLADLDPDDALSTLLDYEQYADPTPDPDWAKPDPEGVRQLREQRETHRRTNAANCISRKCAFSFSA